LSLFLANIWPTINGALLTSTIFDKLLHKLLDCPLHLHPLSFPLPLIPALLFLPLLFISVSPSWRNLPL
jgi:hypothetical protein